MNHTPATIRAELVKHQEALRELHHAARDLGIHGAAGNLARPLNDIGAAIYAIDTWNPPTAKSAPAYCACSSPGCDVCHPSAPSAARVIASLRSLAHTMTAQARHPSVPNDDLLLVEKSEAIRELCVLRDRLPKGERRAAANGQIATIQREPIPAPPAEVLGWASDWETL